MSQQNESGIDTKGSSELKFSTAPAKVKKLGACFFHWSGNRCSGAFDLRRVIGWQGSHGSIQTIRLTEGVNVDIPWEDFDAFKRQLTELEI